MGWSTSSEIVKPLPIEDLLKKETTWWSAYNDLDQWKKDMKECFCSLTGQYEIEKNLILYRFELDEKQRDKVATNASHFQNVIIQTDLPSVTLSETALSLQKKK